MIRAIVLAGLIAFNLTCAGLAIAQEQSTRRENARYLTVEMWKFAPGSRGRALTIYEQNFLHAMRTAGTPLPTIIHPQTGPWDMIVLYPLGGGPTDLEFDLSPTEARWWRILEQRVGVPQALELGNELQRLIVQRDSYFAHEHLGDN